MIARTQVNGLQHTLQTLTPTWPWCPDVHVLSLVVLSWPVCGQVGLLFTHVSNGLRHQLAKNDEHTKKHTIWCQLMFFDLAKLS